LPTILKISPQQYRKLPIVERNDNCVAEPNRSVLEYQELKGKSMDVQKILDTKTGTNSLFTIPGNTSLEEFIRQACEKKIGALLVTDNDGKPVGIVSERDVLYQCNLKTDFKKTTVGEIMTRNLIVVKPADDINTVMDLMISKKIRHLPVVSEDKVLGIITIRDLIHAMRKADQEEIHRLVEYLQSNLITD